MSVRSVLKKILVSPELESHMKKIPKKLGSFGYDPWGYNHDTTMISIALFKKLYDEYFRVASYGRENIPKEGRLLIIANHSGQLPMDGVLVALSMIFNIESPRAGRPMVERFFPSVPFVAPFLNQVGAVLGDPVNCGKMLEKEEAVIVFPEGIRGSGKVFKKRYQLQRFGNGFMHLALTYKTPIIPVGIVGCEETIPSFGNITPLAKLLGVPYIPISIPFILPAKVILNFGQPMNFEGNIQREEEVTQMVEMVKKEIRALIQKGLSQRKGWFR
ncbi:MAG: acyltransferase family protein [Desulfobacterales bacterium]|nr:acyltransferase family protein [Desulfobacterales bacterium]